MTIAHETQQSNDRATISMPTIEFAPASAMPCYASVVEKFGEMHQLRRICDVGGGANPALPLEYIELKAVEYTLLDISATELAKAPPQYRTLVADICDPQLDLDEQFDLICSKMVAEHVCDGSTYHKNIHKLLAPGGIAIHLFPTLYCLPFLVNRLLPESVTSHLLDVFHPRARTFHDKFPAYYSWCRGPTKAQIERIEALGYRVLEYRGYFGHLYYRRIPGIRWAHEMMTDALVRHPFPQLTSYAFVVLQKMPA